jgi:hypothetical protein
MALKAHPMARGFFSRWVLATLRGWMLGVVVTAVLVGIEEAVGVGARSFRRGDTVKQRVRLTLLVLSADLITTGCGHDRSSQARDSAARRTLVGAWRSKIAFRAGPLAAMKDLEFLYAYNAGGTMTESSNYDEAANSSPPAYGVWRQLDPRTFETKYVFYTTKAPSPGDGAPKGIDWWPDASQTKLRTFDSTGAPIAGGGEGTGAGTRIAF